MYLLRTIILILALSPSGLSAETHNLSVTVIDSQTGTPIDGAYIIVENDTSAEPVSTEITQKDRQFQPHTTVLPKGSNVDFPNKDNTQHHVYSFSPAKAFNIELYAGKPEAPVVFDKTGIVELGCNIHDRMKAFIIVTESTIKTQTDAKGQAQLALPPEVASASELRLSLWHSRLVDSTRTVAYTLPLPFSGPADLSLTLAPASMQSGRLDGLQKRFDNL